MFEISLRQMYLITTIVFLTIILLGAHYFADRALDLWYCHAKSGYNQAEKLDTCLAEKGW